MKISTQTPKILLFVSTFVPTVGCTYSIDTEKSRDVDIVVTDYTPLREGHEKPNEIRLDANSVEAKSIDEWIDNNRDGWSKSANSYVNGIVWYIKEDKFNLIEKHVVVETKNGDQMTHSLEDTTLNILRRAFN